MDRRGFWRAVLRSAVPVAQSVADSVAGPVRDLMPEPAAVSKPPGVALRPPGAAPEAAFTEQCAKGCRLCVDACPFFAIVPSYHPSQPGGGDGRPYMVPDRQACQLCGLCMTVCPTGALQVTAAAEVRIGEALLDTMNCLRHRGEACSLCISACPFPDVAIREGQPFPRILSAGCTGCGQCAEVCPTTAIRVIHRA